ncbi:MAG: LuxR C-terminal-related transcriptional regulator [Brevibacterium sp.]|nr:LuxR C-terminal-related transcriptional regulator [Brevibacterium sp.]
MENRLADILSGHNPDLFPNPTPTVSLSPRETDILSHVALGWSNARIAEGLGLRESTVKSS